VPLFADGLKKIRSNLLQIEAGERPKLVKIGVFTKTQLQLINERRLEDELLPIEGVILFRGRHLYDSRCAEDGYSIEEVVEQIQSALDKDSVVDCERGTALISPKDRIDKAGNVIRDEAVFECTQKHPSPELWSVIPRGDGKNHFKK
jgi:hypothetical protein